MHRMTTRHDDLDDSIPRCPLCNARVYKTHRCTARGIELVSMPADLRARAAAAKAQASHPSPVGIVDELPLDFDTDERGVWPSSWPRYTDET